MKTLLEVIKLNKGNINNITIGGELEKYNIGDKVTILGKKCICVGKVNNKNAFVLENHYNMENELPYANESTKLFKDVIQEFNNGVE